MLSRRTRIWLGYGLFGLFAYIVFLVANLPAGMVYRQIASSSGLEKVVRMSGVQGTLWSGRARWAQVAGISLGSLEWDLSFLPLLIGHANLDVTFRSTDGHGGASISAGLGGDLHISQLVAQLPAQALAPLFRGMPISLAGKLSSDLSAVSLEPGKRISLQGRLAWLNAGLVAPQQLEFGDLLLTLVPDAEGSKGQLADQGGPLVAQGTLNLKSNGQYTLAASFAPRSAEQTQLKAALRMLGRPDRAGKVSFSRNGRLFIKK